METEKVVDHIVNWLKDYAVNANIKGFTIGISGGIDSAVTSTLCARTGLDLLCLEMPIHQEDTQFSIRLFLPVPPVDNEQDRFMSLANTRARLRMSTLYYFAALNGYLVAGTGNKVEDFGVGFYTKYGDGGVDLTAPTDGLWGDDRTDEDQIGASYPELEWAMQMNDEGKTIDDFSGRDKEVFNIFKKFNQANQHKMLPIPIYVVMLEMDIPEINGIATLRRIKKEYPDVKVLMYSGQSEDVYALMKETCSLQMNLLNVWLLMKELRNQEGSLESFQLREVEVLKLLASGKRNKDVALGLNLNEKTVSTYKARLMKKLNVDNMVDLLQQAKALELY
ncbi:NH(3)-dependent NAD(+) synthetase [Nymphon striatum]|nr:NH(3)-dependent NAD(+) synthetase [Nymphon striatum]